MEGQPPSYNDATGEKGMPPQQMAPPQQGQLPYPAPGQAYPPPGPAPYYTPQAQPYPVAGQQPPPQPYGQPAQPGYAPPQQQGQQTVVITQPTTIVQTFRECPVQTTCPHCQAQVITGVTFVTGTFAWLLCAIIFIIGCWPCCLIPFCVDGCKDAVHLCPNCRQTIGRWSRL